MKEKNEKCISDRLFYCFVDFGDDIQMRPIVYVVPSYFVAQVLKNTHQHWLSAPGKSGKSHKDTQMRRLLPDYTRVFGSVDNPYSLGWLDQYKNAWNLLNLTKAEALKN